MKQRLLKWATALALVTLHFSCGKKAEDLLALAVGKMTGSIQVYNDKGVAQTDRSGVTVSIDAIPNKTTTTDANGNFSFDNLPYDSYNITFSKTGIGTFRIFGLVHSSTTANTSTAGTVIPTVQLGANSTTTVTALSAVGNTYNGGAGFSYLYTVSPTPTTTNRGFVRVFLGTSNGVSNASYTAYSNLRSAISATVNGGFTQDELVGFGFTSGQTIFLKIYGESVQSNQYLDPSTNRMIFPNLNSSSAPAISFVMP